MTANVSNSYNLKAQIITKLWQFLESYVYSSAYKLTFSSNIEEFQIYDRSTSNLVKDSTNTKKNIYSALLVSK